MWWLRQLATKPAITQTGVILFAGPFIYGAASLNASSANDVAVALRHVSTIEDLRQSDPTEMRDQETLLVDSFSHADDGGGGLFRWEKGDHSADDGGLIIALNRSHDSGRWHRVRTEPGVVSPLFYGAQCNGRDDDAPAINKAVAQIRHQRATTDMEPLQGVLRLPALQCTIKTTVNLTGLRSASVLIDGSGGLVVCAVTGKVCMDAMDSARLSFRDVSLYGAQSDMPRIGLQLGGPSRYVGAPGMYLDHVTISGFFSLAAFYNLNAETQADIKLNASNDAPNAFGAIYDGLNHFAARSDFVPITTNVDQPRSFNDNSCVNCRITTKGLGSVPLWIGYTSELTFENSYISNFGSGVGAILYGLNTNLNLDAHFEATGLTHIFVLSGERHVTLYGLHFREHDMFATQSIFALAADVESATLANVDINIGRIYGRTKPDWFDKPAKYKASGKFTGITPEGWIEPALGFTGTICFSANCVTK